MSSEMPSDATVQTFTAPAAAGSAYCAADIVMPGESRAPFDTLLANVWADWAPSDWQQEELADEIACAFWRRRRLRRAEAHLWAERCGQESGDPRTLGEALAKDCDSQANALEKLRRWWQGNERHLNRIQERLAKLKRLEWEHRQANVDVEHERAQAQSRHVDRVLSAPVPGEIERVLAGQDEIGNFAEPTQCNVPASDQPDTTISGRAGILVSENPGTLAQARTRRERRALERAQRREEKRRVKSA